jgi:hypothetical protein
MSFICRVVIGYFDVDPALAGRAVVPFKPLKAEDLDRIEAVCRAVFGIETRLIDHLTGDGVLLITSTNISKEIYRVACVAHELFAMSAIDHAHRIDLFPRKEIDVSTGDQLTEELRPIQRADAGPAIPLIAKAVHRVIAEHDNLEREVKGQIKAYCASLK